MESSDTVLASQKIAEFEHTLVEFITAWNRAENAVRRAVIELCDSTPESYILTAELGALGLEQALRSLAADRFDEIANAAINYVLKYFNVVRGFRNYYVHGIGLVAFDPAKGEAFGVIDMMSSKKRLTAHQENIGIIEMRAACDHAKQLWQVTQLLLALLPGLSPGRLQIGLSLAELPAEFPLPTPLSKHQSHPLGRSQPAP